MVPNVPIGLNESVFGQCARLCEIAAKENSVWGSATHRGGNGVSQPKLLAKVAVHFVTKYSFTDRKRNQRNDTTNTKLQDDTNTGSDVIHKTAQFVEMSWPVTRAYRLHVAISVMLFLGVLESNLVVSPTWQSIVACKH